MDNLYLTQFDWVTLAVTLSLSLAMLGGFAVGYLMGRQSEKQDNAFNPPLRPDNFHNQL